MPHQSLALLTDLYQLTMSYGYWKSGVAEKATVFNLFFRKCPFGGRYAIAAGLETAVEILRDMHFTDDDVAYLGTLTGNDGQSLFENEFLRYLREMRFQCDVDAIPEGTAVFPHEPLLRVRGPIVQCQILETLLLNIVNFQTLVATKASRICRAAGDDPVLEFGLRRAQGIDGGLSASRAAFIGGCAATSNVLAGRRFGIPVKGTHAHSWVMSFGSEVEAFEAYAAAMPNNCVFLVDTYDTIQGVRNAISVALELRERGHNVVGIRLDSGDLCELSKAAAELLSGAGFPDAAIVASNDLDEFAVEKLKKSGAKISVWGIGTKLATAYDQPALGGVYKLSAVRSEDGTWEPRIKLSEQAIKVSNPGIQQVRRFSDDERFLRDVIFDEDLGPDPNGEAYDQITQQAAEPIEDATHVDLLCPVFRAGKCVYERPAIESIRERSRLQLDSLPDSVVQLQDGNDYSVCLDVQLHALKTQLILKHRNRSE